MGLDAYAYKIDPKEFKEKTGIEVPKDKYVHIVEDAIEELTNKGMDEDQARDLVWGCCKKIAYWRKHSDLQGWMENKYVQACMSDDVALDIFNCRTLRLDEEDLDELEQDCLEENLPETVGFFFGKTCEEDIKDTLLFIDQARDELKAGNIIMYYSWW
jgi:hypothetical protein